MPKRRSAHKRRRWIKRCKRCRKEFRKKLLVPGVYGSYCNRVNCQRVAAEIAKVNDATRRLEHSKEDERRVYLANRQASKVANFGMNYGTGINQSITKAAVVGKATTGTVNLPSQVNTAHELAKAFAKKGVTGE